MQFLRFDPRIDGCPYPVGHGHFHQGFVEAGQAFLPLGQFENQQRAQARLALVMGLVLAVMAVLLFAEFGNLRQALLVLGVVPLATLGGLISLPSPGWRNATAAWSDSIWRR